MRITYYFRGKEEVRTFDRTEVLIGRLSPLSAPDLDLGADAAISRKHARIKIEHGQYLIEDLKSTNGTIVNGDAVERAVLTPGSVILVGETTLKVEISVAAASPVAAPAPPPPAPAAPPAAAPAPVPVVAKPKPVAAKPPVAAVPPKPLEQVQPPKPLAPAAPRKVEVAKPAPVAVAVPAPVPTPAPVVAVEPPPAPEPVAVPAPAPAAPSPVADPGLSQRLARLFELPLTFTPETRLETILQTVLQRVVELVPGGERGALLLLDHKDKLHLRASVPPGELVVSENLARRVMTEGHGFILQRKLDAEPASGSDLIKVETGMYAPLLSKERPLGALYVDSPTHAGAFTEDDMQLLLAAAHYLAVVVYNYELQEDLQRNSALLDRVSVKFPPRTQERLLENVRTDKLQPGATKTEVTILYAELRGFAKASTELEPAELVGLLNEHYPRLLEAIFRFDGTLDRFGGEAIVAVFGSPEGDPQHHEKAVLAALAMQAAVKELAAKRGPRAPSAWDFCAGLHCGEVLSGFVGTPDRLVFTVLGDVTQRAIAYCQGAQSGEVLIGPELFQKVFKYVEADRISIAVQPEGELAAYRVKTAKT